MEDAARKYGHGRRVGVGRGVAAHAKRPMFGPLASGRREEVAHLVVAHLRDRLVPSHGRHQSEPRRVFHDGAQAIS
eukprot:1909113-Pyramimonas_sp.AAC.1